MDPEKRNPKKKDSSSVVCVSNCTRWAVSDFGIIEYKRKLSEIGSLWMIAHQSHCKLTRAADWKLKKVELVLCLEWKESRA